MKEVEAERHKADVEMTKIESKDMPLDVHHPKLNSHSQQLLNLQTLNGVTDQDIQEVVAAKGYYPIDTPISMYTDEFIEGTLINKWENVNRAIDKMKGK